jgi:hypothetical protein
LSTLNFMSNPIVKRIVMNRDVNAGGYMVELAVTCDLR